jgi:hypothetical protein
VINNTQDTIDSRDVIDRIKELAALLAAHEKEQGDTTNSKPFENQTELDLLKDLAQQGEFYAQNWGAAGVLLIRDSYFIEFAIELAEENSDYLGQLGHWPYTCIDWNQAVTELQYNYKPLDFGGNTYWAR